MFIRKNESREVTSSDTNNVFLTPVSSSNLCNFLFEILAYSTWCCASYLFIANYGVVKLCVCVVKPKSLIVLRCLWSTTIAHFKSSL